MDVECEACGTLNVVSGSNVTVRSVVFRCAECEAVSSADPTRRDQAVFPDAAVALCRPELLPFDEELGDFAVIDPVERGRHPSFHDRPTLRVPVYRGSWYVRWLERAGLALVMVLSAVRSLVTDG
jgi:hypothetical protein